MSMITGCPACGTMFKVVPDQLKISDGWVRCGHCSEVFDASAHMVPAAALREAGVAADDPADDPSLFDEASRAVTAPAPIDMTSADIPITFADVRAAGDPPVRGVFAPVNDEQTDTALPLPFRESEEPVRAAPDPEDAADAIELEDVGFIRKARRRAFWARPAVRFLLVLVLLALGALLGAQVALEERDHLAAMQPELRPWLEKLCEPIGCAIRPPRRIESIAIDSSTFSKLRADTYRLSLTLRNQAQQPVAIPAIELTLTDTQDQPVLRRVLQPRELGAGADTIPSGADWAALAAISVNGSGVTRIAGYRLLAFYP